MEKGNIMHLEEKTIESNLVFDGHIIKVYQDKALLEDGTTAGRELVVHSGGVCVVPLTDKNEVIMVEQFRYAFKTPLLEIPAGKLEKGEDPEKAGLRELKEETGAECEEFISLGVCYPTVAYDTEKIHMYLAKGLKFASRKLDEGEFLDVKKLPLEKAVEMVMNNELPDAKTQIAILKTARIMGI